MVQYFSLCCSTASLWDSWKDVVCVLREHLLKGKKKSPSKAKIKKFLSGYFDLKFQNCCRGHLLPGITCRLALLSLSRH